MRECPPGIRLFSTQTHTRWTFVVLVSGSAHMRHLLRRVLYVAMRLHLAAQRLWFGLFTSGTERHPRGGMVVRYAHHGHLYRARLSNVAFHGFAFAAGANQDTPAHVRSFVGPDASGVHTVPVSASFLGMDDVRLTDARGRVHVFRGPEPITTTRVAAGRKDPMVW